MTATRHNTAKGDDIAAVLKDGTRLFVECKGSISPRGNQLDCWEKAALAIFGAIVDTETHRPADRHAIAVPDTEMYRATLQRLGTFLVRQAITLLWVRPDGSILVDGAPNDSFV